MITRTRTLLFGFLLALACIALSLRADDGAVFARGFRPNGVYALNDIDSVNTFNGNLMLNIPLGQQYHSNGTLAYQFLLHYDSHAWDIYGYDGVSLTQPDYRTSPFDTGIFFYYSYWTPGTYHAPQYAIAPSSVDPSAPPPNVSGTESVPHGNAGMGWTFGFGEIRGSRSATDYRVSYAAPDGVTSRFTANLHGSPDTNITSLVLYSTDGTYLRLRYLQAQATASSDLAEIDFPDGIRKRFRCVQDCAGGRYPRWLVDTISDPHGNFLTIDYSDTHGTAGATQPPSDGGFWIWTIQEWSRNDADADGQTAPKYSDGSQSARNASTLVRTHYAYFGSRHPREVRLERLALAAPDGRFANYDLTYTEKGIPSEVGVPWPENGGGLLVPYEKPVINTKTVALRGISELLAVKLPNPAGTTAAAAPCFQPCAGDAAVAGIWQFRYIDDLPPESTWEAPVAGVYYLTKFDAGRLRVVKTPAGGGYRYEYAQRGYPVFHCVDRGQPGIVLTGVAKRQQIDGNENDVTNAAWYYVGQGWLDNADFSGTATCKAPREFIAAVIAPPANTPVTPCPTSQPTCYGMNPGTSRISLSFFSVKPNRDGIAFEHMAWPYTEEELLCPDGTTPCAGMDGAKYLSQRDVSGDYGTFAADPAGAVRRIFPRLTRGGETHTSVQVLRETFAQYESSDDSCPDGPGAQCVSANLRRKLERRVFRDDVNTPYIETTSGDFDGLGHYRTTSTANDFQVANFPNSGKVETRTATMTYNDGVVYVPHSGLPANAPTANDPLNPAPWFLNTYTLSTTQETHGNSVGPIFARRATFDGARAFLHVLRTFATYGANPPNDNTNDIVEQIDRTGSVVNNAPQVLVRTTSSGGYSGSPVYTEDTVLQYGVAKSRAYVTTAGANIQTIANDTVDRNTGLPTITADGSGASMWYAYDALGRPTSVTPPSGSVAPSSTPPSTGATPQTYEYHYATAGRVGDEPPGTALGATTLRISRVNGPDATYTYDQLGRVTQQDEAIPGGKTNTIKTLYAVKGMTLSELATPPDGGAATVTTKHTFDVLDREITLKLPDGKTRDTLYNGTRDVTVTNNQVGTAPNVLTPVQTSFARDGFGRVRKANDNAARGEYDYDALDHLTDAAVYDIASRTNVQERVFHYDARGFLTSEQHPEQNNITISHEKIDAKGHAHRFTYPDSSLTLRFVYDLAERVTDVLGAGGTLKHFDYYPDDSSVAAGTRGRVQTAVRWNFLPAAGGASDGTPIDVDLKYQYDYAGRPVNVVFGSTYRACFNTSTTYHYDDLGQLSQIDYPTFTTPGGSSAPGRSVKMTYGNGRLIGLGTPSDLFAFGSLAYFHNGMESKITRTRGVQISDIVTSDTNGMARPGGYTWQYNGGKSESGSYVYDGAGNITKIDTDTYSYDSTYRLARVTIDSRTRSYTYDAFGNIQEWKDVTMNVPHPFATDLTTNHLSKTGTMYDSLGNLTKLPDPRPASLFPTEPTHTLAFTYDPLSSMTHFEGPGIGRSYLYDADDERVAVLDYKTPGDANNLLHEHWSVRALSHVVLRDFDRTNGLWSWAKDYVYRGRQLSSTVGANEAVRDAHVDHLGSIRFFTDANGHFATTNGIADSPRKYWPFGELTSTRPLPERMAFTGHERDEDGTNLPDADLDYMHARYYNAVMGRFLSLDPAAATLERPQSWNRYVYVANNPINLFDADGRVDNRTAADRAILEDPHVLAAVDEIMTRTGFQHPLADRAEYGTLITKQGDQKFGTDGVVTSGSPKHVDYKMSKSGKTTASGETIAGSIHSHTGTGPLNGHEKLVGNHSSGTCTGGTCTADKGVAQKTGQPVYILNERWELIKYDPATGQDTVLLNKKDYADYLDRAHAADQAQQSKDKQ